jgi:RNA polymerase sigma-70 factor (ECF subfamily)
MEAEFTELLRRHDDGLRALAFRLLGDRDRMDDVLQEAYLKAYRGLGAFEGRSAPGTWLYRIVYNACLDALRATARPPLVTLDALEQRADPGADADARSNARDLIARGLAALPPAQRAAVLLVDAQGFDYAAAAEILGVPAGTVASRLHGARRELRRLLDDEEET